jgi:hypothetical protein
LASRRSTGRGYLGGGFVELLHLLLAV